MKYINWTHLVPGAKCNSVRKALETAFATTNVDSMEPLTGGRSSALVYKVVVNHKPYVMRLVMEVDVLTDPHRHFVALNAAASAGIAPPVHYTNADDGISIIEFIEHSPLRTAFTMPEELFGKLATHIKAIHALPLFPALVGFLDGVEALIERFRSFQLLPSSATEEHFHYFSLVQRAYPRHDQDLVSSHNDLNPTNILHSNGKIWIVDWEASFANDRYVDLAVVNIFFGSGERGEDIMLDTYFGDSLNDYHRARFFSMRQVCFMYVAMLFMNLAFSTRKSDFVPRASMNTMRLHDMHRQLGSGQTSISSAEQYLYYAKILLNESLLQMKTERFQQSIAVLQRGQSC